MILARFFIYISFVLAIIFPILVSFSGRFGLAFLVSGLKDVALIAVAFFVILNIGYRQNRNIKPIGILILSFFIILLPRFFGYVGLTEGINGLRYYSLYPLFCFALLVYSNSDIRYPSALNFAKLMYFFGGLYVLLGMMEFFDDSVIQIVHGIAKSEMKHTELAAGTRLISIFFNPINFGIFLCFSVSSAFYVHLEKSKNGLHWLVFWCFALGAFWCSFFTLSRTVFIVYLLQMVLFVLILMFRRNYISWFIVFCVVIIFIYYLPTIISGLDDRLIGRFLGILSSDTYSSNTRVQHWLEAMHAIDNPLYVIMGLGVGTSNPTRDSLGYTIENSFVTLYLDLGIIGVSLFLFILLYSFFKVKDVSNRNLRAYLYMNLFVFVVASLANDVIRNYPFSFFIWITIFYIHSSTNINRIVKV